MGIKLQWELESEGGWNEIGEDPEVLASRLRRNRRIRNIALVALFVLALVGGIVAYRLNRTDRQLHHDLEAAIAAETLALRIGDREAFLSWQLNEGPWRVVQRRLFDQYQAEMDRMTVGGEIVSMDIEANLARVVLREHLDDAPYLRVWFYRYDDDNGWLHIPPRASYWGGTSAKRTAHFDFFYYQEDELLAEALSLRLNGWWETACRMMGCSTVGPPRIKVRIEPDPLAELGWAAYDEQTLLIPSPLLGRIPEQGQVDAQLRLDLADLLAARWAQYFVETEFAGSEPPALPLPELGALYRGDAPNLFWLHSDVVWLESELQIWLRHAFDDSWPPSGFVDALSTEYPGKFVPDFLAAIRQEGGALPGLETVMGKPVLGLPLDWSNYLTYRLRDEAQLVAQGASADILAPLRDPEFDSRQTSLIDDIAVEALALPDTIQIVETHWFDEVLWAEVHFVPVSAVGQSDPVYLSSYEPFRFVQGRWVHTAPDLADWGNPQEQRGRQVVLRFYELDAPVAEGLLDTLDETYAQLIADLGITESRPLITVRVAPFGDAAGSSPLPGAPTTLTGEPGQLPSRLQVIVPSPYVTVLAASEHPQDYVRLTAAREMTQILVSGLTEAYPGSQHPLSVALLRWESKQLGLPDSYLPALPPIEPGLTPPQSLDRLFESRSTVYYTPQDYIAADLLIEMLIEQYGPDALTPLMQNLPTSQSADAWLFNSLGVHASEVEAEWLARLEIVLKERAP